jgi:hypothetical protein
VDVEARSVGMRLKLQVLSKEFSPLHFSTSANEAANKLTLALGGKEAPVGRRKLLKLLKASGAVRRRFAVKGRLVSGVAGLFLGKPLDGLLTLLRVTESYGRIDGARLEDLTHFDQRFDGLWAEVGTGSPIAIVRDADYLNWRYSQYPFEGVEAFSLERGSDLLGFAAIHKAWEGEERFVAVLELAAVSDPPGAHAQLLGEVVRRAVAAGAATITARTADPHLDALLVRFGFRPRTSSYSPVTYKNNTSLGDDLFEDASSWYLSQGDGDGCYFFDETPE